MAMEEGTMGLLELSIFIILAISIMIVLFLFLSKNKKTYRMAYGFVLGHLVFLSLAMIPALAAIKFNVNHPMASEETTLFFGVAGVLWAISMVFLLVGLVKFSSNKNHNKMSVS